MKKKTKARKQRLNNLIIILLLSVILLIMSTYAWFTSNKQVDINSIDVKVATSSGLQISANAIDWKTVLQKKALFDHEGYDSAVNQFPYIMQPVSSALELKDNGYMRMFFGDIVSDIDAGTADPTGNFLLSSIEQTEIDSKTIPDDDLADNEYARGNFIAFDVFIKSEAKVDELYMSGSVEEKATKLPDGTTDPAYKERGTTNAVRVAIIKATASTAIDDGALVAQAKSTAGGTVHLWEPNADAHTVTGIDNAEQALRWVAPGTLSLTNSPVQPCNGLAEPFSKYILQEATAANYPDEIKIITTAANNGVSSKKGEKPIMEIVGGLDAGITKFRVYMWIEGQDVDCENNASGTDIEFNLSFRTDNSF